MNIIAILGLAITVVCIAKPVITFIVDEYREIKSKIKNK
jgi:hypothetical protein